MNHSLYLNPQILRRGSSWKAAPMFTWLTFTQTLTLRSMSRPWTRPERASRLHRSWSLLLVLVTLFLNISLSRSRYQKKKNKKIHGLAMIKCVLGPRKLPFLKYCIHYLTSSLEFWSGYLHGPELCTRYLIPFTYCLRHILHKTFNFHKI